MFNKWYKKNSFNKYPAGLFGIGQVPIPGMAKSHPGLLPSEIQARKEDLIKEQKIEFERQQIALQEERERPKREAEMAKQKMEEDAWIARQQAEFARQQAESARQQAEAEPKYEQMALDKSHQMDVVRDRLSKGWTIVSDDGAWITIQRLIPPKLSGLGWFKRRYYV